MDVVRTLVENFQLTFGVNEVLFFGSLAFFATAILIAFRFGKIYVFALIAVLSVLMNIFAIKPFEIFGIATYGGNVMYGVVFFATDLLNEHYGKKEAMKAVYIGFFSLLIYLFSSIVFVKMIPNMEAYDAESIQNAFVTLFSPALVIVIASLTAYILSNTFDVHCYDYIHKKTGEKYLWIRNNASTLVSQLIDTIVFTFLLTALDFTINLGLFTIELVPVFEWQFFWEILVFMYIFKLIVALFDTPFLYLSKVVAKRYGIETESIKKSTKKATKTKS